MSRYPARHRAIRQYKAKQKAGLTTPASQPRPAWQTITCRACTLKIHPPELVVWHGVWGNGFWGHPACGEGS